MFIGVNGPHLERVPANESRSVGIAIPWRAKATSKTALRTDMVKLFKLMEVVAGGTKIVKGLEISLILKQRIERKQKPRKRAR